MRYWGKCIQNWSTLAHSGKKQFYSDSNFKQLPAIQDMPKGMPICAKRPPTLPLPSWQTHHSAFLKPSCVSCLKNAGSRNVRLWLVHPILLTYIGHTEELVLGKSARIQRFDKLQTHLYEYITPLYCNNILSKIDFLKEKIRRGQKPNKNGRKIV
jgi:hypothetical protein